MNFDVSGEPANSQQLPPLTEEQQLLQRLAAGEMNAFWHLWQRHKDYLGNCCLKWTNGNSTEAEDLLSQAMLKAWEKAQKYAGKITNFKSWLTTLTRNFWLDLKRRPCANQVEDIEVYAEREELGLVAVDDTPESALEEEEKKRVIRAAIDELPTWLRETFILHYYQELSNQEIAERQGISDANVRQRISQARRILRPKLSSYFIGDADSKSDTTKVAAKPVKSQKARKKVAKVEADLPETEPSYSGVNTEYSDPKPEDETEFLPSTQPLFVGWVEARNPTETVVVGWVHHPRNPTDHTEPSETVVGWAHHPRNPTDHTEPSETVVGWVHHPRNPTDHTEPSETVVGWAHHPRNPTDHTEPNLLFRMPKSTFLCTNISTNTGIDSS